MVLAVAPLTDVDRWARGSGLEIVLLVTGAILLTRFATWLGGRIIHRIDAKAHETDALVRSEAAKHRHALAQVVRNFLIQSADGPRRSRTDDLRPASRG